MNSKYKNKVKMNIPMCLACILLCLTMFSFHMMSGLYARYATTATGEDGARVVKFGDITIVENGDFVAVGSGKMLVTPGVDIQKQITVNFTSSEVAAYVFILLDVPGFSKAANNMDYTGINGKISWTVSDTWTYLTAEGNADTGYQYVYYKLLAPNSELSVDFLKALDPSADVKKHIDVANDLVAADFGGTTKFEFEIQACAAQYNGTSEKTGVEHAMEAWNSVK